MSCFIFCRPKHGVSTFLILKITEFASSDFWLRFFLCCHLFVDGNDKLVSSVTKQIWSRFCEKKSRDDELFISKCASQFISAQFSSLSFQFGDIATNEIGKKPELRINRFYN
jgi:hypothetical protein